MPTSHRRGFAPGRRSAPRRKLVWATANGDIALGAAPTFNNIDLVANLRTAGASVLGATVIRTHATLYIDQTGRAVANKWQVGLIVEDLDNVGAVSNLLNNPSRDWAYWTQRAAVSAGGAIGQELFEIDLRAKRKFEEMEQSWLMCTANNSGVAMTVRYAVRTLVALP